MSLDREIRRLTIYAIYHPEGIVEDYITFFLDVLKGCHSDIYVVCNGEMKQTALDKLLRYTTYIFQRENRGYDVAGWKYILQKLHSEGTLEKYDEVILCNDSFYGPIFNLQDILMEMDNRPLDFWGLTMHPESYEINRGKTPEHIQSFFVAIHKNMYAHPAFWKYWEEIELSDSNFQDAIFKHELRFTEVFAKLGFRYGAYVEEGYFKTENPGCNFNPYYITPLELIRDKHCPILKKKALCEKNLNITNGEEPCEVLRYIEYETDYPIHFLLENLCRTVQEDVLYKSLHKIFILDERGTYCREYGGNLKFLFIVHNIDKTLYDFCSRLIKDFLKETENLRVVWLEKENPNWEEYALADYNAIGYLGNIGTVESMNMGENILFLEELIENMLSSQWYLSRIWEILDKIYQAEVLYPLVSEGRVQQKAFWCKPEKLISVLEGKKYQYGAICTRERASFYHQQIDDTIKLLRKKKYIPDIFNRENVWKNSEMKAFISRNTKLYIYGTGIYGRRLLEELKQEEKDKIQAFVVSDGQPINSVEGYRVIEYSQYRVMCANDEACGLIVALSKKVQKEVLRNSNFTEVKNVFYL